MMKLPTKQVENIIDKANRKIMYYVWRHKDKVDEVVLNERRKAVSEELAIWEGFLTNSKYLVGEDFTMADVIFFPHLAVLARGSLSFENRPNLKRYYDDLSQRPSILASWPPHFKDTPPTEMFAKI